MFDFFHKRQPKQEEEAKIKLTASYRPQMEGVELKPNNIKLTWRIENLSLFPVYVKSIGFSATSKGQSYYEIPYIYLNVEKLPLQLGSRRDLSNVVEIALSDGNQMEKARERRYMYVSTSGGCFEYCAVPFPDEVFSKPRIIYGQRATSRDVPH